MKFGSKLEGFLIPQWSSNYVRYKYLQTLLKQSVIGDYTESSEAFVEEELVLESDSVDSSLKSDSGEADEDSHDVTVEPLPTFSDDSSIVIDIVSHTKSNQIPNVENRVELQSDIIKQVADQFEKYGHLTLGNLLHGRQVPKSHKSCLNILTPTKQGVLIPIPEDKNVEMSSSDVETGHHDRLRTPFPEKIKNLKSRISKRFTRSRRMDLLPLFDESLQADIRKVMLHYLVEMDYVRALVLYLKKDIANKGDKIDLAYMSLFQKACIALWDISDKLNMFLKVNTLAVYKILKKKDKLMGTDDLKKIYTTYKNILLSLDTTQQLNQEIMELYGYVSKTQIADFGHLKQQVEYTLDTQQKSSPTFLWFLMGCCFVTLINCAFLSLYNFKSECAMDIVITQIPIYRFVFVVSMLWWGFGWCQNYLEKYGVNYQFLFEMSSNYSVQDHHYYLFGAVETLLCLVLFMVFLLDAKLCIFSSHSMFYLYPIVFLSLSVVVLFIPHKSLKLKIRRRLFLLIGRVIVTPLGLSGPVTLGASIVADVMCSLTKPLMDLMYIGYYFSSGFSPRDVATQSTTYKILAPVAVCFPYFLRFSQCAKRFLSEGRMLHVGNMGKYLSGMLCVIVAAIDWTWCCNMTTLQSSILVYTIYAFATIYNFLWDYLVDWGLALSMDIFKTRDGRRMYSKESYSIACVINLLCRCTWAITTMPFSILKNQQLNSDVLNLSVSLIEIFRRIVWVTFRLESEHLLNSYKYRTALWVPKLYSCKNIIVQELQILNPSM
ncbi:bifunctional EXS [Babesia duncani]|uniref:Bifunctional EXS n=1 Tax=Babesia duncani TaxID=323732 RepID=A0AAD9PJ28_9APIC|nr:bifunctional EXS [Babesia duncani]